MIIRIGMAQIDPALGLPEKNLEIHLRSIEAAEEQDVDLLLFPELSLTGYLLKDMVPDIARPESDPFFKPLLDASARLDLSFGFVERGEDYRCFNSQLYLSGGKRVHLHRKAYLPTYGMFDERRYFAPGELLRSFPTRFGRLAMLICEDLWHPSMPYLAFLDGALGLLVASASPIQGLESTGDTGLPTNAASWDLLLRQHARQYAGFVAFCNRAGVEDGSSFWGGSRLIDAAGERVAEAPLHEPSLLVAEIDLDALGRRRQGFSLLRDERPELAFRSLERILRSRAGLEDDSELRS